MPGHPPTGSQATGLPRSPRRDYNGACLLGAAKSTDEVAAYGTRLAVLPELAACGHACAYVAALPPCSRRYLADNIDEPDAFWQSARLRHPTFNTAPSCSCPFDRCLCLLHAFPIVHQRSADRRLLTPTYPRQPQPQWHPKLLRPQPRRRSTRRRSACRRS